MDINSILRNLGMALVVIGIILFVGFGIYNILTTEVNLIIKISIAAIMIGIILALFSLLKERIEKKDKEIERKY